MDNLSILPLGLQDQKDFIRFADQFIGKGYFHSGNFTLQVELSTLGSHCSSFVLKDKLGSIQGLRLTYAPQIWQNNVKCYFLPPLDIENKSIGYFKSLFVDPKYQNKGWGPLLSKKSIEVLKLMKAKYILTHSWKESPNNSSVRYLEKLGFRQLGEVTHFWKDCDYLCSGCQVKPCKCTAVEMLYKL